MKNLDLTKGLYFSQRVLLELTSNGFTREQAYSIVQKNAMITWKNNTPFENLSKDPKIIKKIPVNKLKKLFNLDYHSRKINIIFKRVKKINMNKGKKLYEGKAKIIYLTNDKHLVIQHFKDDATAFNNLKKSKVEGKGGLQ